MEPCYICGGRTTLVDVDQHRREKRENPELIEDLVLVCAECRMSIPNGVGPPLVALVQGDMSSQVEQAICTEDLDVALSKVDSATGLRLEAIQIAQSVASAHEIDGVVCLESGASLALVITNILNTVDPPGSGPVDELVVASAPDCSSEQSLKLDDEIQLFVGDAPYARGSNDPREWVATAPGWHDACWDPAKTIFDRSGEELTEERLTKILGLLDFVLDPWPEHLNRSITWTESAVFASLACAALHQGADTAAVRQVIEETEPHDIDFADRRLFGEKLASFFNPSGESRAGRAVVAGVDVDIIAASQAWEAKAKSQVLGVAPSPVATDNFGFKPMTTAELDVLRAEIDRRLECNDLDGLEVLIDRKNVEQLAELDMKDSELWIEWRREVVMRSRAGLPLTDDQERAMWRVWGTFKSKDVK